jgi:AAA family ATP:ADP antiporter
MTAATKTRVVAPALVLFGIMAAHALLETARDALLLTRLGADHLAWAYLGIAGAAVLAVAGLRRWVGVRDPRRVLVGLLAVAAAGTTALAFTIALAPSVVFLLYVWTGVVAALVVPAFWTVVDRSLHVGDAKRVFGGIAAGGTLGALTGSAIAAGLAGLVPAHHLVTAGALVLGAATAAAIRYLPRGGDEVRLPGRTRARGGIEKAALAERPTRYVRRLVVLGLASTITLTLGDLMFKRMVAGHLPGSELATALGAINTGINVTGLLIQVLVTPRLLSRLGVVGALTVLPSIVLATALGFVFTGAAIAIIALKLGDAGLRHSVHRVASEILYLPLATGLRDATKPLIDVLGQRGGQALAAVAAVVAIACGGGPLVLGVMTAVAGGGWLAAVALTRGAYIQLFRDTLATGGIARDVRLPALDADSTALLTESLASPDESEALAALDLLARRGGRVPALVLYHPNQAVVRRALALLDREVRVDVQRALGHLIDHEAPQIRAAALAAASRNGLHAERLAAALTDAEPDVRAAALVGAAVASNRLSPGIEALVTGSVDEQGAIARAIGRAPSELFRPVLDRLSASRDPGVVREVLRVLERAPQLAEIERLIHRLDDPRLRGDVRRVLTAAGHGHLERLVTALEDPATPINVRRHLPRTISRFASKRAAAALVSRLVREPDGTTEFKILRALGRMRADRPDLRIDHAPVREYARRTVEDATRYAALAARFAALTAGLPTTAGGELLGELLAEKQRQVIERLFRALGVLHPGSDLRSVYDAIHSSDDERRAAAREILEDMLTGDLRPLLDVLDRAPVPAGVFPTYEALVAALLVDPSDSLRCVAAYHVAERRLIALRPELERLRPASALVSSAFDQAIARLGEASHA